MDPVRIPPELASTAAYRLEQLARELRTGRYTTVGQLQEATSRLLEQLTREIKR